MERRTPKETCTDRASRPAGGPTPWTDRSTAAQGREKLRKRIIRQPPGFAVALLITVVVAMQLLENKLARLEYETFMLQ